MNDGVVTQGPDGIWVVTYANGDRIVMNECDFDMIAGYSTTGDRLEISEEST